MPNGHISTEYGSLPGFPRTALYVITEMAAWEAPGILRSILNQIWGILGGFEILRVEVFGQGFSVIML